MTDRDDFRGGYPRAPMPTTITMYGMSPEPTYPRVSPSFPLVPGQAMVGTTEPTSAEAIKTNLKARIAWLERELSQHEAWVQELAILRRVLAAYDAPLDEKSTERKEG